MPKTSSLRTQLAIDGMTCASCSAGIEKKLSRMDGVVDAQVNFATAKATVSHTNSITRSDLQSSIEGLGYSVVQPSGSGEAVSTNGGNLQPRIVVAVVASLPILAVSMISSLQFSGWQWFVAALSTPVVFWSGWGFHRSAFLNISHRMTTMDTLISIGSLAAWAWSAVVLIGNFDDGHIYFETAAVIITLILLGKWLEVRGKKRSGAAIAALADLNVSSVRLTDGRDIPLAELHPGMRFLVRPGEKIATDGTVVQGRSAVNCSMITGEPAPVDVEPGDEVIGATINTSGSLHVQATKVGAETALAQIIRLVDQAQSSRADVQRLADRVSSVFVPLAMAASLLTLCAWLATGNTASEAFTAAVAVLIIACPCALGLATPLAILAGTGRGARSGLIIKGGEVLEDTRSIDTVVLDKTGTITTGKMEVTELYPPDVDAPIVTLAAAVESLSEHPTARAIVRKVPKTKFGHHVVETFENLPGRGVIGQVDGVDIQVGRRSLFDTVPEQVTSTADTAEKQGSTVVLAGRQGTAEAVFVLADRIKPSSASAVTSLKNLGMRTVLLTGDNQTTAQTVADALDIDETIAEVLPAQKADTIRSLQQSGRRVAMVGDGINDGPALAQADLGIAMGTGTDVALEASDITIVGGDLRAVGDAVTLARRTLRTIKGNLFWAFAYNSAAIPLAALGLLQPMVAAVAMGASSLFVVFNSLRLHRFGGRQATEAL